jgi:fatty acid amide hydrolase
LAYLFTRVGQRHVGHFLRIVPYRVMTTAQYQQLLHRQYAYRWRFARALRARQLDALIDPPSPTPAIVHGQFYANFGLVYTALYNFLGTPAGVVSTTRVRPGEESDRPASRDVIERCFARIESGSAGLPVGVQVVAPWWREDVVLAVMRGLEQHFRQHEQYPLFSSF